MRLSNELLRATTAADLNALFDNNVRVELSFLRDYVTVEGYEGDITTDDIAITISRLGFMNSDDSRRLAGTLADKIFLPLKRLMEDPENKCFLYHIVALTRIGYTPPPAPEFGTSIAMRHAICLALLDQKTYHPYYLNTGR